jgi:hypothetical protein
MTPSRLPSPILTELGRWCCYPAVTVMGVPGMTAPPVSGDPFGEFGAFATSGMQGNDEKSGRLVLSDADRVREALLASRIAVEHIRIAAQSDSRATANYAARAVDNSRRLAGGDAGLHLNLLAGHVTWLRSLPAGVGELR